MDAKQLKRDLEEYLGYNYTQNQELKIIEESIFGSIMSYLRPVTKDVFGTPTVSNNLSDEFRKEAVLKQFEGIKQVSNEFYIDELVVTFMCKAHNDWILMHKYDLEKNELKNPEKFAPLELLTKKEFNEYLNVITPIFNCLDIPIEKKAVENAFERRQLLFMLKNEIYTGDNITEKIMNIKDTNPELMEVSSVKPKSIQDIYESKEVAENIAKHVKERIHLNFADKLKEVLLHDNEVGFFSSENQRAKKQIYKFSDNISQKKIGFKKQGLPLPEKPVTKTLFKLAKIGGVMFAKNVKANDYKYYDCYQNSNQFVDYKKCSDDQKRAIDRREKTLKKFVDTIDYNRDADTPGIISMVVVRDTAMTFYKRYMHTEDYNKKRKEIIQVPITQRELAKMGILPEEIGWEKEKKALIHSSDKVVLCTPDTRLKQRKEFKSLLVELAENKSFDNGKMGMESIKKAYQNNKEKDEKSL